MSTDGHRDPSWDELQTFLAVLEEGSLSGAARRLDITQPTARARITTLENSLATALFTRSASGMVPTRQAESLAKHARAMQRAAQALVRNSLSEPGANGGTVRLSVSDFIGIEVLPPMLRELRHDHPELRLELVLSNRTANLLEQEVDVAIRHVRPDQQALVASKLTTVPIGLFAHERYLAGRKPPKSVADLADHDMIGPDRARLDLSIMRELIPDLPPERLAIRTDSHPAQLSAARAGLGIAYAQVPVAERSPGLVRVLPELSIGTLDVWLVTHEDLRQEPRIRAVMDHLTRVFRQTA